ncbi:MAG: WG repeat-containing protein [Haliscomenobacter sp.]|nr:WG repeat-containing protein [Haliscomenobacter sp.]
MNQLLLFVLVFFLSNFLELNAQNNLVEWVVPLKKEFSVVGKPSPDQYNFRENGKLYMALPAAKPVELPYDSIEYVHEDIWMVWKNSLQGVFSDKKGELLPPVYHEVFPGNPGGWAYVVSKYGMLAVVNDKNELIVPWSTLRFIALNPLNDTILEYIGNKGARFPKLGTVTRKGEIIPHEQTDQYLDRIFREVSAGKIVYYCKKGGKLSRDTFASATDFINDIAVVQKGGLFGYLKRDGSWLIPPRFQAASPFHANGVAAAKEKDRYGILKTDGTWLVQPRFDALQNATLKIFQYKEGEKTGLLDFKGNVILPAGAYPSFQIHGSESFGVKVADTIQVYNYQGKLLPIPGVVFYQGNGNYFQIKQRRMGSNGRISEWSGIAFASTGEWFIPPVISGMVNIGNHFIAVEAKVDGLDSLAGIKIEGKQGGKFLIFNRAGKVLTPVPVEMVTRIAIQSFLVYAVNKKSGLLLPAGEALPAEYDEIRYIGNNWVALKKEGMTGLIRLKGIP